MSYNFSTGIGFRNGEFNGVIGTLLLFNDLLPSASLPLDGSAPAELAIGNEIVLGGEITATLGDTFDDKLIRLNIAAFNPTIGPSTSAYWQGAIPTVATGGVFFPLTYTGPNAALHQKIAVLVARSVPDKLGFAFVMKVTADLLDAVNGQQINNRDRFLKSIFSLTIGDLNNAPASAYRPIAGGDFVSIRADIIDAETNLIFKSARNPADLNNFLKIPAAASFYDAYPGGTSGRYISSLTATTAGATTAGLGPVVDVSRTFNLNFNALDPQYIVNADQLSPKELNDVSLVISGPSFAGAVTNDALTDIRAILIRTDAVSNNIYFFDDYDGAEGVIPLSLPVGTIDGALVGPASWSENLTLQESYINLNIDGTLLAPGGEYRLIINTYDSTNRRTGAHISPPLFASYVLPIAPPLTSQFYDYSDFTNGEALLTVAPHSRLKCELTVDIAGYNAALAAAGYTGSFIFYAKSIFATLETKVEGVQFGGLNPNILTENAELVLTPTEAVVSVVFRINETIAGLINVPILWAITIAQDNGAGGFEEVVIRYRQYIDVREFDDDAADVLVNTRFYKIDGYPAIKTPINNICNVDKFIVEVEKNVSADPGDVVAHIYPILPGDIIDGETIEEEAATPPIYLPPLTSLKLENVNNFTGNFAYYEVRADLLDLDRCYNVTSLVKQYVFPTVDYCPLLPGLPPDAGTIDKILTGPTWRILSTLDTLYNYVVGLGVPFNVTKNQIEDVTTGLPIGTPLIWGNPSTDFYRVYCSFPSIINSVRVRYDIEFYYDAGSGPHLIRLSVDEVIVIPAAPGPWTPIQAPYICDDLDF